MLPCGHDLVAQRALGAERQLVLGRLAVDRGSASRADAGGVVGAGAVALLADHEQQAEIARGPARAAPSAA